MLVHRSMGTIFEHNLVDFVLQSMHCNKYMNQCLDSKKEPLFYKCKVRLVLHFDPIFVGVAAFE